MSNKKVFLIILALSAAVILTITAVFIAGQKSKKQSSVVQTDDFPMLNKNSLALKQKLTATDKTVGDLVLEKNPEFKISYLISNDEFYVEILKPDYKKLKAEAIEWFSDKGFNKTDICALNIHFAVTKEIAESEKLNVTDLTVEGCKPI